MASASSAFRADFINFDNQDRGLSSEEKFRKTLTIAGAAALCSLCYEENPRGALQSDEKFDWVRTQGILTHNQLWLLGSGQPIRSQKHRPRNVAPLLAWSNRIGAFLIGFRGTHDMCDVLTNIDVREATDSELGSSFHAGFMSRAALYTPLIEYLATRNKVVVCGHSLG